MEMKHCCYARLTRHIISLPHLLSDDLGFNMLNDALNGNKPEELNFLHFLGEGTNSNPVNRRISNALFRMVSRKI